MTILIILGIVFAVILIDSIVYRYNKKSFDLIVEYYDKYKGKWDEWGEEDQWSLFKPIVILIGRPTKIVKKLAWFFR